MGSQLCLEHNKSMIGNKETTIHTCIGARYAHEKLVKGCQLCLGHNGGCQAAMGVKDKIGGLLKVLTNLIIVWC